MITKVLQQAEIERLSFLIRTVNKEIKHLRYSDNKVFKIDFTLEKAKTLETDEELAEQLEAFTGRFCRLQDTIENKLIPTWLKAKGETVRLAIDNLDKAEKMGVLSSTDEWLAVRKLRNKMIHEYIEDLIILTNALNVAHRSVPLLVKTAEEIINDLN